MQLNPFDLAGPDFLIFYGCLVAALAAIVWFARYAAGVGNDAGPPDPTLDAYETACLAGGGSRVALLAVASLVDRGHVRLNGRSLAWRDKPPAGTLHPIERELIARAPPSVGAARATLGRSIDAIEATLRGEGLLAGREAHLAGQSAALGATLLALVVGGIKVWVGLSRGRPVGLLAVLMLVATVAIATPFFLRPAQTSRGARILGRLRDRRPARARSAAPVLADPADATLVALWGLSALRSHPAYADLRGGFETTSSGDGGSSCSSSSCSSSSCGGGGCGGCSS